MEEVLTGGFGITFGHVIGSNVTKVSTIYFERVDEARHLYATESSFWASFWTEQLFSISNFFAGMRDLSVLEIDSVQADEYIMNKKCCRYFSPHNDPSSAHRHCVQHSFEEPAPIK